MSSLSFSLSDLSRSSVPEIWSLCNEKLGCFDKDPSCLFYRELCSIYIQDPEADKPSLIRFSEYFERKTGIEYEMGSAIYRPEVNEVLNDLFRVGAAEKMCSSIDQSAIQFFISHFLKELSRLNDNKVLVFQKSNLISLSRDSLKKLCLTVKFDISHAFTPFEAYSHIPFNIRVEAKFMVLNRGVQLRSVSLEGDASDVEFARKLLLGEPERSSLLQQKNIQQALVSGRKTGIDALMTLVLHSPELVVGLFKAIEMGADIRSVQKVIQMGSSKIHQFLSVVGEFVEGGLEGLVDFGGAGSLWKRRELKEKVPEIREKFEAQVTAMRLCSTSNEDLAVLCSAPPPRFRRRSSLLSGGLLRISPILEGEENPSETPIDWGRGRRRQSLAKIDCSSGLHPLG